MRAALAAALLALALVGCGLKGDPVTPREAAEETADARGR